MLLSHPSQACSFLSPHLPQRNPYPFPKPPTLSIKQPISLSPSSPSFHFSSCRALNEPLQLSPTNTIASSDEHPIQANLDNQEKPKTEGGRIEIEKEKKEKKSFWGAVSLIIGTAVGPGMLSLPSATIRSGPIPSTVAIILSWVYVVSSIVLVAELSFAAMEEEGVKEVSFTSLATNALGPNFGVFVAVIYASLSFSLLIACVSGIGSLVVEQFPLLNPTIARVLFPCFVGIVIAFFPFKVIDITNRLLCSLMLFSITALVGIGFSTGRSSLLGSLSFASWRPVSIMPAIPVTVLTLGFHVITPFICRIAGDSVYDARKAILFAGAVPLVMVLSWNAVVLGLAGTGKLACNDPIKLLLSVNSSALPAVKTFAFAALSTSLIGYAVSFPKQLADTVRLIAERFGKKEMGRGGRVRSAVYSRKNVGTFGQEVAMEGFNRGPAEDYGSESTNGSVSLDVSSSRNSVLVTWFILLVPILIASFFREAFSKALDFAGVYANCFLFGVLPPAMTWIHRSRRRRRSSTPMENLLPGRTVALSILLGVAVILGIWH